MNRARPRLAAVTVVACASLGLTACGSDSSSEEAAGTSSPPAASATTTAPTSSAPSGPISEERCAKNKAAGKITFLTSFQYAGSAGILDVVAAKDSGYFSQLCLDVELQAGTTNAQLVAAGTAQIAGLGGPSDVITAEANGSDKGKIVAIATYGNTSIIEVLSNTGGPVTSVKDFSGKTLGYKGAVPPQVLAMLKAEGVDPAKVKQVSVGYDPSILPKGDVDLLTAYKSNEPIGLRAAGADITEWDPADYGVKSAFNTQIANKEWATKNPTAVQDFLRASFYAYAEVAKDPTKALAAAAKLSEGQYDQDANKARFAAEDALIQKSMISGHGVGWQTAEQFDAEYQTLKEFGLVKGDVDLSALVDTSSVEAIYDAETLVWPAP